MAYQAQIGWARSACILCLLGCAGCFTAAPANSPITELQPRVITSEQVQFIHDGVTTEEQVLMTLGEPDYWWDHRRVFAYQWATSKYETVWPWPIGTVVEPGPAGLFIVNNYLLIAFDESHRVRRHEGEQSTLAHYASLDDLRKQWTASEAPP